MRGLAEASSSPSGVILARLAVLQIQRLAMTRNVLATLFLHC